MLEVTVIDDAAAAEATLDPIRARLLQELAEPASASMLASRVGLTRQKVNYHLRALEQHGLIELAQERKRGNMTERLMRATASSFVISPAVLGTMEPDPARAPDQLSAMWLLALAARLVRELGQLLRAARSERKALATFAIDTEVTFASAKERAEFAAELADAVESLVSRYHAPSGRKHRLIVALHPSITRKLNKKAEDS